MTETPEADPRSQDGPEERPDVLDAMATYSSDGQGDETGSDAAAAAAVEPGGRASVEGDREPPGPA